MTGRIIIFISIGILLLSIAGGVFIWWPKLQSYFNLDEQTLLIDSRLGEKLQYFSKLKEISQKLGDYKESIAKIDSAFPTDPNVSVPPLIVYMLKLTADSGVTVKGLNIGTSVGESAGNGLSESKFNLDGSSASYAAFKNLINNIYNSARMIDVDSVSLTAPAVSEKKPESKEGSQTASEYQFSISLRTNFYLEQSVQAGIGPEKKLPM